MAKEHFNVVFIGHVDHGKSTSVGRLLFDAGGVGEQTMRKLKEEAVWFMIEYGINKQTIADKIGLTLAEIEVIQKKKMN
jgi:sulfate adenylyltransferase subunit 1 (EFTu-like GTPase family)